MRTGVPLLSVRFLTPYAIHPDLLDERGGGEEKEREKDLEPLPSQHPKKSARFTTCRVLPFLVAMFAFHVKLIYSIL